MNLLFEIFSEEIPARMQNAACEQMRLGLEKILLENGLQFSGIFIYSTPRRLAALVGGLPSQQCNVVSERKGPKIDAPEKAIQGFLQSCGIRYVEQLEKREIKGEYYYFAKIQQEARSSKDILAEILPAFIKNFSWPKSMRWGSGSLTWVRPIRSIIAILGNEIIPFELEGVKSSNHTFGHRFLSKDKIIIDNPENYENLLKNAYVIADRDKRKKLVKAQIEEIASQKNLQLAPDEALLEEVVGLVEYPTSYLGNFAEKFTALPLEVLQTSMRSHQKYFTLLQANGRIAPHFIVVSNMQTSDNGAKIIEGNERVLRARLSDAEFFWQQDLKIPLEQNISKLSSMLFHAKLGTMQQKVERLTALVNILAIWIPKADLKSAEKAARLAKADLVSQMVGEFPELQGVMGSYYAANQGISKEISEAIKEHYSPNGSDDEVPKNPLAIAVSLADKVDNLVGFFAIGEKPSGSKDPYALRRNCLGVIRIILENNLRIPLSIMLDKALNNYPSALLKNNLQAKNEIISQLMEFFEDRIKFSLKAQNIAPQIISAIFADHGEDDLHRLVIRCHALADFVNSGEGEILIAAYKRANNILQKEEKAGDKFSGSVDSSLLQLPQETVLYKSSKMVKEQMQELLSQENYANAMKALQSLANPLNDYFENVMVNIEDNRIRKNRLQQLAKIRNLFLLIADFSKL